MPIVRGKQVELVTATNQGAQPQSNRGATVAPGATDDVNAGYAVGSYWVDTTADVHYVCVDASAGAAIWVVVGSNGLTGKAFTLQAGRNGTTATGSFYRLTNGMVMDAVNRGAPVPAAKLVYYAWTRTDADSATLEVLNNGSVVDELNSAAAGVTSKTLSTPVTIAAGLVSFRNKSDVGLNNTSNVQITALFVLD